MSNHHGSHKFIAIALGAALLLALPSLSTAAAHGGGRFRHDDGASAPMPYVQSAQLDLGVNARRNDELGQSVAVTPDGATALVGVPGESIGTTMRAGAAQVYRKPWILGQRDPARPRQPVPRKQWPGHERGAERGREHGPGVHPRLLRSTGGELQ